MDPASPADPCDRAAREVFRWDWSPIIPAIGIVLLAISGLLYAFCYDLYIRVFTYLIGLVYQYPFVDWMYLPAQIDCWRQGINVYAGTPCDPLNRPMDYSPLWLRLTFIPTGKDAVLWTGLGLDVAFIAMLGFLPRPRRAVEFVIMLFAAYASATLLAMERANADLLSFALAVLAGICLERRFAVRVVGHGVILIAGLLKFYPLVMLIMLLRERVARCIVLGLVAAVLLVGVGFAFRGELARAFANLPSWSYYEPDIWGASRLPGGAVEFLRAIGLRGAWLGEPGNANPISWISAGALLLAMLSAAFWLACSASVRAALDALPVRHANFLVLGAALTCGCFLAGQSIRYRAIMMLLTMPALLVLARDRRSRRARWAFGIAVACVLAVVWTAFLVRAGGAIFGFSRPPITTGPNLGYWFWLLQELACWSLTAILLAVLFWFVTRSPMFRSFAPPLPSTWRHRVIVARS